VIGKYQPSTKYQHYFCTTVTKQTFLDSRLLNLGLAAHLAQICQKMDRKNSKISFNIYHIYIYSGFLGRPIASSVIIAEPAAQCSRVY
jgi:hypothetical protein